MSERPAPAAAPRSAPAPQRAAVSAPAPAAAAAQPAPPASPPSAGRVPDGTPWGEVVEQLGIVGMVKQLAQHCELVSQDEGRIELKLPRGQEKFLEKSYQDRLKAALRKYYSEDLHVTITSGESTGASPVEIAARERERQHAKAAAEIEQDPFVQELVKDFGGRVSSIKPIQSQ